MLKEHILARLRGEIVENPNYVWLHSHTGLGQREHSSSIAPKDFKDFKPLASKKASSLRRSVVPRPTCKDGKLQHQTLGWLALACLALIDPNIRPLPFEISKFCAWSWSHDPITKTTNARAACKHVTLWRHDYGRDDWLGRGCGVRVDSSFFSVIRRENWNPR